MLEKQLIINTGPAETRIALMEKERVAELHIERSSDLGLVGRIYKAKVTRVLAGMQSAFVDIGEERAGFLYVTEVFNDEFIELSRAALKGTTEDLSVDEIQKRTKWIKHPIEKLLRDGQEILVQVTKQPFHNKGARLSMFLTLPGRYVVLSPHFSHIGISKKIDDENERQRLRGVIESIKPDDVSVIVRTAARGVSDELIARDLQCLLAVWGGVQRAVVGAASGAILYQDLDIIQRVVRDQYNDDVGKIVIDDAQAHEKLKHFLRAGIPGAESRLELYDGKAPIFDVYGIEMDINRALRRKIDLPSGGSLVVDQTEALTAFDVNTGSYVGRQSAQETVFRTNLEAVKQVVHQLRLRNIGGIIVIDFIDMDDAEDRERIFSELVEELKQDKAKTHVLKVSEFGLVQMTRKRTQESLGHVLLDECPMCQGAGKIKSVVTEAHDLLREITRVHLQTNCAVIDVKTRDDIRDWILEEEQLWFQSLIDQYGLTVNFHMSDVTLSALHENSFNVTAVP